MARLTTKFHSKKNYYAPYYRLACALAAGALLIFSLIALITFSSSDSSWFYHSSAQLAAHNGAGSVGALYAAFLIYFLGVGAYCVPLILMYLVYVSWFGCSWADEWDRVMALVLLVVTTAALSVVYGIAPAQTTPGGLIGMQTVKYALRLFDPFGALTFLCAFFAISLVLIARSWGVAFLGVIASLVSAVTSKRFVLSVYGFVKKVVIQVVLVARMAVGWLTQLWQGLLVHNEQDTLVEFEYGEEVEDDFTDLVRPIAPAHEPIAREVLVNEPESPVAIVQSADVVGDQEPLGVRYSVPIRDIFIGVSEDLGDDQLVQELENRATLLEEKLARFGVHGSVAGIKRGPVVTLFEYKPNIDTKISKIVALEDDLALALQALSIRIIAPIPGKSLVGFEVANNRRKAVPLARIINSAAYTDDKASLPLILGEDTIGMPVVVDLARMPHFLVAGSTGSGKSVALNVMLVSLLSKMSPDELRLILIDPKRLEFAPYADIAHLLFPIVTDPKKAAPILKWVVNTMEQRYERMAHWGVRNVFDYQAHIAKTGKDEPMPFIVVVIDELADLMMTAGREIEDLMARITQMARAAGIHLIVATQRPSVDVITGVIKVNFPSRIAFRVTSKIDSRTILDAGGADKLLGKGDMLFMDAQGAQVRRLHGAYVSDKEIVGLVSHIKSQRTVVYLDIQEVLSADAQGSDIDDELYGQVRDYVMRIDEVSISLLQREFRIGYNRSARLISKLESHGLLLPADGGKMRKVVR